MSVKGATGSQVVTLLRVPTQHFLNGVLEPYGTHWKHDYWRFYEANMCPFRKQVCILVMGTLVMGTAWIQTHYNKPIFPMIHKITSPGICVSASQWETTLQGKVISYWQGTCAKWSLHPIAHFTEIFYWGSSWQESITWTELMGNHYWHR